MKSNPLYTDMRLTELAEVKRAQPSWTIEEYTRNSGDKGKLAALDLQVSSVCFILVVRRKGFLLGYLAGNLASSGGREWGPEAFILLIQIHPRSKVKNNSDHGFLVINNVGALNSFRKTTPAVCLLAVVSKEERGMHKQRDGCVLGRCHRAENVNPWYFCCILPKQRDLEHPGQSLSQAPKSLKSIQD